MERPVREAGDDAAETVGRNRALLDVFSHRACARDSVLQSAPRCPPSVQRTSPRSSARRWMGPPPHPIRCAVCAAALTSGPAHKSCAEIKRLCSASRLRRAKRAPSRAHDAREAVMQPLRLPALPDGEQAERVILEIRACFRPRRASDLDMMQRHMSFGVGDEGVNDAKAPVDRGVDERPRSWGHVDKVGCRCVEALRMCVHPAQSRR